MRFAELRLGGWAAKIKLAGDTSWDDQLNAYG